MCYLIISVNLILYGGSGKLGLLVVILHVTLLKQIVAEVNAAPPTTQPADTVFQPAWPLGLYAPIFGYKIDPMFARKSFGRISPVECT